MYDIKILDLKKLKEKKKKKYQSLIRAGFKHVPYTDNLLNENQVYLTAIGVTFENTPVGLALTIQNPQLRTSELISFFVAEEHNTTQAPYALLKFWEKECLTQNLVCQLAIYPDEEPYLKELESFLIKQNWEGKRLVALECYYQDCREFHPPWFDKSYTLPSEYEIFLWKDLLPEEAAAIKEAVSKKNIPPSVNPFEGNVEFEPHTSLGIRYKGEVLGWSITQLISPTQLYYFCLYVDYSLQMKGTGIMLLIQSIKKQQLCPFHESLFRINVLQVHSKWEKFVRHRLAPYATKFTEYSQAWHDLRSLQ